MEEPKVTSGVNDVEVKPNMIAPPVNYNDIRTAWLMHKESIHPYITELYKNYFMYEQDRKAQLIKDKEERRTNIKSQLTHMYTTYFYNMLLDSDIRFTATDTKDAHPWAATSILNLAEYVASNDDGMDAMRDAIFDLSLLGRGIYKTSYIYNKTDVKFMDRDLKEKTIVDKDDQPVLRYVSPYNFLAFGAKNKRDARVYIERILHPIQNLDREYAIYGIKVNKKEIEEKGEYVDYMDRDAIKINMPFFNNENGRDILNDDTYNIKNKMIEVFEVHTKTTISIYFNGIYKGTFKSLGPSKKLKYHVISSRKVAGSQRGLGVGYVVAPTQKVYDSVLNMRIDNVKLALNKMFFMDSQSTLFGNASTMKIRPGMIYKVRSVDSVKEMVVSEVKQSAYAEVDAMFQMTQGLTGTSAPALGMQQKVERTSAGAEILKNAADLQLRPAIKSITKEMGETLREIILLSLVYMDDDTMMKICGNLDLKKIPIEDIMNGFVFNFEMVSQSSENLSVRRQQLTSALELANNAVDAAWAKILDSRPIAKELLKTYWLDLEWELSYEEIQKMMVDFKKIQDSLQAQWITPPGMQPPEQWSPWAPTQAAPVAIEPPGTGGWLQMPPNLTWKNA